MKKILLLFVLLLSITSVVNAESRTPTEVIAVKHSDSAVLAWRNPDCDMTFIRVYGVKSGKKNLIEDSFDLDANAVNEFEFTLTDADEYIINFRCGDGTDRYYTVNKFVDVTKTDTFIRDWEINYSEPTGVTVGLDRNDKKTGKSSLYIVSDTLKYNTASISQNVCDIIDKTSEYRLGFWIKASSADSIRVNLSYNKHSNKLTFVPDVSDSVGEWKYVTYTFSGNYAGYVSFDAATYAHEIRIDDVTLYKLKDGKESGVNLISNSAFTLADNIVNNDVSNLKGVKNQNKVTLSWTAPTGVDNDRIRIYNDGKVVSEVSKDAVSTEIDYRECTSNTYTAVVIDNKGNVSQGVSVTPDNPQKTMLLRDYFDSDALTDDITKVSYTKNYTVTDGILNIDKGKGMHILPADSADEFIYSIKLKPNTNRNNRNVGVVFGYDEETSEYGVVYFNGATMTVAKSDVSNIGDVTDTIATVTTESDVLSLDKMSVVKIMQTSDSLSVEVNGVTLYSGDSTNLSGKFGLSTVGLLGIYVDEVEIKRTEPADFAIYNDDYLKTGKTGFVNKQRPASDLFIEGDHLRYKENGGNSLWVLESGAELVDFVFDFDYTFKAYKYTPGNYCGVAFGYDDEAETVFRIGLRNEGKIFFGKNDVVSDTALATFKEYPMNFETDRTYRMRVSVKDGKMSLYCNGELLMEYSGEKFDYSGGSFGFISNGGGAEFKNILITPYHEIPTETGEVSYSQKLAGSSVLDEGIVKLTGDVSVSEGTNGLNINSESGSTVYKIDNLIPKKSFSYTAEFSLAENSDNSSGFGLIFRSDYDYGYYRILLAKDGTITFAKCEDEFSGSDGITLASIESGLDFTKETSLKLIGMNNTLYVYVNNKLYLTADMKNEIGGFGFETASTSVMLNSISVNDVTIADYAVVDGYYAVIEDISVTDNKVSFNTLAGLDINNAYLVGTVYENNALKDVEIINPVTVFAGDDNAYTFTFDENVGENTVKIMLFEDLDKITPMAKALKK